MQNLSFNVFNILILLGCLQGVLLSFLLLRNNQFRKKSNFFLGIMILSFSLSNLRQVLIDVGLARIYPVTWFLPLTFGMLLPVVFYFFLQYLMNPGYRPGMKLLYMLIPFFAHFIFELTGLILFLSKAPFLTTHFRILGNISVTFEIVSIIYCLAVILIVFADLNRYDRKLKNNFSSLENKSLKWLQNLVIALFGLWILWSVPYVLEVYTRHFLQWHHYPLWIGMSIVVYWIGYSAYHRTEIFQSPFFDSSETPAEKSKLSDKTEEYHTRLIKRMDTHKPYLNPELSLESLASEIELSAGYLSQIINKKEGMSFYDFINKYRVEEAKQILLNPAFNHYSILAISMESGFNSKSTFNAAFKRYSGTTPSRFKKESLLKATSQVEIAK